MIVNLTRWAENEFNRTCSEAGVTCNKSTEDVEGWDFICDWPVRAIEYIPHDRRAPALTARIQIKSCENPPATATINMKNALRYAQSETPYFVIVYVAAAHDHPVHCYAVHCWDTHIARTLRRARQADGDGRDDLHKISMTIAFADSDRHDSDLLQWMEETIRVVGPDYTAAKRRLNKTLGYEAGRFAGTMSFTGVTLAEFVDHSIGLASSFTATRIRIVDKRFGIEARETEFEGDDVVGTIKLEPAECSIQLIDDVGDARMIDGQLYQPPVLNLPSELQKLRITGGFFDIVAVKDSGILFNIHIEQDQSANLDVLEQVTFMAVAIDRGAVEIEIRRRNMPTVSLILPQTINSHARALAAPGSAIRALQRIGTPENRACIEFSLNDLEAAWEEVARFRVFLDAQLTTSSTFDNVAEAKGLARRLLAYGYAQVAGWTFYAIVERRVVSESLQGVRLTTTFGPSRILASSVTSREAADARDVIRAEFERWLERKRTGTVILLDGCFNDVLGNQSSAGLVAGPVNVGETRIYLDP